MLILKLTSQGGGMPHPFNFASVEHTIITEEAAVLEEVKRQGHVTIAEKG